MKLNPHLAHSMLQHWGLSESTVQPITVGHLNETYLATLGQQKFILQRLSPIFAPEVNLDIETITGHLAAAGMATPRLLRCSQGEPWATDEAGRCWRMLTHVAGHCFERAERPRLAASAGELLGRFHATLEGLNHVFLAPRLGVHDTQAHLARLVAALDKHTDHEAYDQIAPLAEQVLVGAQKLHFGAQPLPQRIVHGDPKLANILFDDQDQALALVDLDTLATMSIDEELGDALRSWCNSNGERRGDNRFNVTLFEAALAGYSRGAPGFLTHGEIAALPQAPLRIATELAARFVRDAFEQSYFSWDSSHYRASWEHQLARAHSQWDVAKSAYEQLGACSAIVARQFGLTLS